MQVQPYVFFYGRCEEALEFYKGAFGGTYEIQRLTPDTPMAENHETDLQNGVMHAAFTAPGVSFMASDGRERKSVDPDAGNISLAISSDDKAEGERIFQALSAGGTVTVPLGPAPWGGRFGIVADRFGTEWVLSIP